jgi:hypothetical protein
MSTKTEHEHDDIERARRADAPPVRAREARSGESKMSRTAGAIARVVGAYERAEELIAQLLPPSAITRMLMAEQGVSEAEAHRYQLVVRERWKELGELEGRDGRVMRYRAGLERQAQLADEEGDRKAAIAALAVLVKLEGEPPAPVAALPPPRSSGIVVTQSGAVVPHDDSPIQVTAEELTAEIVRRLGDPT